MSDTDKPEAGERCKVQTSDGETEAIWTGHCWAVDNGSKILDETGVQSWEAAPLQDELKITRPEE
ncbi:MAG: hypothetical protein K0U98_12370 [Deltaproteobacteria bacterium]|nr:hypothetical protein [Deltaproteobacteria bacterium]